MATIPPTVTGVTDPNSRPKVVPEFTLTKVASGLDGSLQVQHAPGDENGIYVVQQSGKITRVEGDKKTTFMDISKSISSGGEQGLLSVAFHPDYAKNGRVFVDYTDKKGDTHISEYNTRAVSGGGPAASPKTQTAGIATWRGAATVGLAALAVGGLFKSGAIAKAVHLPPNIIRGGAAIAACAIGALLLTACSTTSKLGPGAAQSTADATVNSGTGKDLMVIKQPYANHNGGQLQFGPDGNLYVGMGDGGGGGDTENRAQNTKEHLGKMLRLDVDHPAAGKNYGIPTDNPYAKSAGGANDPKPEIWANGVRNPWRFSFDSKTGDMWVGDVGQGEWEEVDYLPAGTKPGANLGWNALEGSHHFKDTAMTDGQRIDPVLEYSHDEGSSITGGYVYRGNDIPSLQGYYLYADIASNKIRGLKLEDGKVVDRRQFAVGDSYMVGFGEDSKGELYVATLGGDVFKFAPTGEGKVGKPKPADGTAPVSEPKDNAKATIVDIGVQVGKFRFDKETIHVPAGKVTLKLDNNDKSYHNIGIQKNGVNTSSEMIGPGEKTEVTATLEAGKTYEFYCLPHLGMGMKGTIIVDAE